MTFPTHKIQYRRRGVRCAPVCRGRSTRPPADFDVILCGCGFSPKTGTLLSAFADISPNRGITRHYAKKYISCVGNDLSVVPQNNRKIYGSSRRRPLCLHCHSEPLGEESRFAYFYFVLSEILRFAQDDKSPPQTPISPSFMGTGVDKPRLTLYTVQPENDFQF